MFFSSTLISLVPSTDIFKRTIQNTIDRNILIYSTDNNNEGDKTLTIECSNSYTALNGGPIQIQFKVIVSPDCSQEIINGIDIVDQVYTIHAPKLIVTPNWVTSRASCPITFTLKLKSKTSASSVNTIVNTVVTNNDLLAD